MSNGISRRHFLGTAMAGAVAANAADVAAKSALPTRVLGRTGAKASILALGCGSRLLSYQDEEKGIEAIHLAIQSGITYIDDRRTNQSCHPQSEWRCLPKTTSHLLESRYSVAIRCQAPRRCELLAQPSSSPET
jgi:hypothetical protein